MPNLNNARFIRQALSSVIGEHSVSEVLIYDNGSTDASLSIARALDSPKIRIIEGGANLGATLGRHEAVLAATNDLICYLDGDDFIAQGAVDAALAALTTNDLDIALFDLFNVDFDGANPQPFIIPPRQAFDGRTACEMTLGSWRMHIWGIMRKSLYLDAWVAFTPHGYSDDELLTRHILARASRVAGCDGRFYYRVIRKPQSAHHVIGGNRTAIRSLALAVERGFADDSITRQQDMVLRFLVGIVRRVPTGKITRLQAVSLVDEYRTIPLGPPRHLGARLRDSFLRLARPLLD